MLEKEYAFFEKNKAELLKKYRNKFIVIVKEAVVDSYDSQDEALRESSKKYKLGSFLIQKVSDGEEDVIQRFFSRVII